MWRCLQNKSETLLTSGRRADGVPVSRLRHVWIKLSLHFLSESPLPVRSVMKTHICSVIEGNRGRFRFYFERVCTTCVWSVRASLENESEGTSPSSEKTSLVSSHRTTRPHLYSTLINIIRFSFKLLLFNVTVNYLQYVICSSSERLHWYQI